MFLVSTYWRNGINIGQMRLFKSKKKAKKYWDKLVKPYGWTSFVRAYKVFEDKEPMLLRTEQHWKDA